MKDLPKPLISIIVPVYNVERFLTRCIESIVSQTYENIEILLIDDGSPDNCPGMCDEWARKDSRIFVYHKQNGGLSDARNYGFIKSHGEYITYIDSDDFVSGKYIEKMYEMIVQYDADISCVSYTPLRDDNDIPIIVDMEYSVQIMDGKSACKELFTTKKISSMAYGKLIKRTKVIEFPVRRNHEDIATICKFLYYAEKVAVSMLPCYFSNWYNDSSICHTKSFKNIDDSIWAEIERAKFFDSIKENELADYAWNQVGGHMIYTIVDYPQYRKQWKHYVKEFQKNTSSFILRFKLLFAYLFPHIYRKIRTKH